MTRVAAIELNISGIITAVFCEETEFWEELFFRKGNNFLNSFDRNTNDQLKNFIFDISVSYYPVTTTFSFNNITLKGFGLQRGDDNFLINWEATPIIKPDNTPSENPFKAFLLQEQFWNRFTTHLPLVVFEMHVYKDNRFEIGFINKELESFFPNFSKEKININNASFYENVYPEDIEKLKDSIIQLNQIDTWEVEYRVINAGKTQWIRIFGRLAASRNSDHKTVIAYLEDITENKLKDARLRILDFSFKNATTAIHFVLDDGSTFEFNEAMCKLTGYTNEEFQKLSLFDTNPLITKSGWKERWESLKNVGTRVVHSKIKRKDGSIIDIEIKSELINFEGVELNCAFINDITEKKKTEEALKLVDFAFRNAPGPMHFFKENGKILDCNLAACNLLGYTKKEYLKLNLLDINQCITPEIFKSIWNSLTVDSSKVMQYRFTKKDRELVDVEIRANKIFYGGLELVCASFIDITEKKKTEEALKLVDFAFRSTPTPMHFIKEGGQLIDCNYAASELVGYTKEEYIKLKIFDIDKNLTPEIFQERWDSIPVGTYKARYTSIISKDKRIIDVEIQTNKIHYGDIELMCTSFIDITEKKKTEERLRLFDFSFMNVKTAILLIEKNGQLNDFNEATHNLLGYTREEIKELNVFNIDENLTTESREIFWNTLRKEKKIIHYRTFKKKDGTTVELEIDANMISFEGREINFAFLNDITEKKRTEKQLKIVDYAFRNATIPLHFVRKDGSIYDFNEKACELLGYTHEEYQHLTIFDISQRWTPENWNQRWEMLKNGSSDASITKLKKKDHSLTDIEVRTTIFEYENEELSFSSIIDISERVKVKKALIKSNERYENAMIATSEVIWEADVIENTLYFSNNYTLIFGYPVDGLELFSDNSWLRNIHPNDKFKINTLEFEITKGIKDKWEVEYKFKKANGEYVDVLDRGFCVKDESDNVIRLVGTLQDITQRKAEETRLKLLESVVVNTNDVVIITEAEPYDLPGPKILYVNEEFTKMSGYTREEAIGQTPRLLQSGKTDRKELDKIRESLTNWKPCEVTVCNTKKNGEDFWVNIRLTPVANEKGWFTHWVSVQRDVTKEIAADKERKALLKELSENITELKQFGYITTHNLRSPLTNLVSISKLIDENKIEDKKTKLLIGVFKDSTVQLNDTINDLIKILFIKDRKNLTTTDLNFELILEIVTNSISALLQLNMVKIETDFSLASIVNFSQPYLESIFLNLLTNSIKYAHPNRKPIIKITSEKTIDGKIKLIYSDNGIGMNMKTVGKRIFGLYQRFHDHPESKGLGLYLIHSQITALRGTIVVDSEENIGTKFTITFA